MDLTKTYPRSPKETLAGLVHIPRMIDKARACSQDSLGQYIFPCPLDKMVLEFLNIEVEEFLEQASSEIRMRLWLLGRCSGKSSEQKQSLNQRILNKKPDTIEKKKKFTELIDRVNPARKDIITWVDLIDLEEGRL
tara:strand:- start:179 stop:586 length:408 start_codon:yes stop_codon:yes gene_type:complete